MNSQGNYQMKYHIEDMDVYYHGSYRFKVLRSDPGRIQYQNIHASYDGIIDIAYLADNSFWSELKASNDPEVMSAAKAAMEKAKPEEA